MESIIREQYTNPLLSLKTRPTSLPPKSPKFEYPQESKSADQNLIWQMKTL